MKKKLALIISMICIASTLFACNSNKPKEDVKNIKEDEQKVDNTKIEIDKISSNTDNNSFKINSSDSKDLKLYKEAYNTCYELYKQGFVLRNYVLDVEEMCFEHGKNTVYEIIYNCIYKDMDIEVPLEALKNEQITLNRRLNSLCENSNTKDYIKNFKITYDKGEYLSVEKALLSDMSCDEFMLGSYDKKINLAIENQKKTLDVMKKELQSMIK